MSKYETLIKILDQLRQEAPIEYRRFHPAESDSEKLNQARSRAFIHLFLKVKFGLLKFKEREALITDGGFDGGVDAYFIDQEVKKTYFIQSKFRVTSDNFSNKEIEMKELLNMDIDRISDGEKQDENGNNYSGKILQLQREMSSVSDIGKYKTEVIILANLRDVLPSKLKKLTGGFGCEVFDFQRTYSELVFPIVSGTYYNHEELRIQLNLNNKTSQGSRISYQVSTEHIQCEISVLFVPTLEIAKTLHKYKNSILKFNPRSYLELAKNSVNQEIEKTITKVKTNEFALFNNGITMLSYDTEFNDKIGLKNIAQLIISQPQIINGGQTAYTLSRIYENALIATRALGDEVKRNNYIENIFEGKEVLLKVITMPNETINEPKQLELIEAISKATNQQSPVDEADRRSNDKIQIEIQNAIYDSFGYFYERKKGEYSDGIRSGYIRKSQIIDREVFIRLCKSCDLFPSEARRSSVKVLFKEENFNKTLNNVNRHEEYFFAYRCYQKLNDIEKTHANNLHNKFGVAAYGNSIRYGKYAVVSACRILYDDHKSIDKYEYIVNLVLNNWTEFETIVSTYIHNLDYFWSYKDSNEKEVRVENFDNYYKGKTLNGDLKHFFDKLKETEKSSIL